MKTSKRPKDARGIIAWSLEWEQAHVGFANAVRNLPPRLRARRPKGFAHSVWDQVEHVRRATRVLLELCRNATYEDVLRWPDDYWPAPGAKPTAAQWSAGIRQVQRDTKALARFVANFRGDLAARLPHRTGQTCLRLVLTAMDHTAYHTGQIVSLRRALNTWPPP